MVSKNKGKTPDITEIDAEKVWKARYFYMGRVNDSISAATVLMRYNFSSSIITCITSLNFSSIRKIKEYNAVHNKYDMQIPTGKDKIAEPRYILNNQQTYHGYNVLMILYMRFHEEDPNETIDVNAMLKAWAVYKGLKYNINLNINRFWYLCQYMNIKHIADEYVDGGKMIYSKEYKSFHYVSNNSQRSPGVTNYLPLKNLKEILNMFKKDRDDTNKKDQSGDNRGAHSKYA